jgi:hypothetical protein
MDNDKIRQEFYNTILSIENTRKVGNDYKELSRQIRDFAHENRVSIKDLITTTTPVSQRIYLNSLKFNVNKIDKLERIVGNFNSAFRANIEPDDLTQKDVDEFNLNNKSVEQGNIRTAERKKLAESLGTKFTPTKTSKTGKTTTIPLVDQAEVDKQSAMDRAKKAGENVQTDVYKSLGFGAGAGAGAESPMSTPPETPPVSPKPPTTVRPKKYRSEKFITKAVPPPPPAPPTSLRVGGYRGVDTPPRLPTGPNPDQLPQPPNFQEPVLPVFGIPEAEAMPIVDAIPIVDGVPMDGVEPAMPPDMPDMPDEPPAPPEPSGSKVTESSIKQLPSKLANIPQDRLNSDFKTIAELIADIQYFFKNYSYLLKTEERQFKKVNKKNMAQLIELHKRIVGKLYSPDLVTGGKKIGIIIDADTYITDKINEILLTKSLDNLQPENVVVNIEGTAENPDRNKVGSYEIMKSQNGVLNAKRTPVFRSLPSVGNIFLNGTPKNNTHLQSLPSQRFDPVTIATRETVTNPFISKQKSVRFKEIF